MHGKTVFFPSLFSIALTDWLTDTMKILISSNYIYTGCIRSKEAKILLT